MTKFILSVKCIIKMKTNKTKRAGRSKRRTLKRKHRGGATRKLHDGSVVEGDIHKGKVKGVGTLTSTDGSRYIGPFNGFIPHGKGTLIMSDRSKYVGMFSHGGINGWGVMTDPKGNVTECTFLTTDEGDALANGVGTARYADGTVYEGSFRNGKFNGHGTLRMTDGSVFEGEFVEGLANGLGALTHADGTVEEDEFRHIKGEIVNVGMPLLELKPGILDPMLEIGYDVQRAIDEWPSDASAADP
jgi:hypothetical protein